MFCRSLQPVEKSARGRRRHVWVVATRRKTATAPRRRRARPGVETRRENYRRATRSTRTTKDAGTHRPGSTRCRSAPAAGWPRGPRLRQTLPDDSAGAARSRSCCCRPWRLRPGSVRVDKGCPRAVWARTLKLRLERAVLRLVCLFTLGLEVCQNARGSSYPFKTGAAHTPPKTINQPWVAQTRARADNNPGADGQHEY